MRGCVKTVEAVEKGVTDGLVALNIGAAVRASDSSQAGTACFASNWRL